MTGRRERRRDVSQSIFPDEIGLEYGVYGDFRLRSACQPIYARRGDVLAPVAVEMLMQPHRDGLPVPQGIFREQVAPSDRLHVETMCRMLHLRNFAFVGADGLDLFFSYEPRVNHHLGRALAEIRMTARHLGEYGLHAGMMVCEIPEQATGDEAVLRAIVREMRRNGLRIAIDDFGVGNSTEEKLRLLEPDIVKIDGGWFAEVCRHSAAEKLFRPLLSLLHEHGVKVLVEGIEQAEHLRVALEGGADLLQGRLLAGPTPVGAIFPEEPLAMEDLLRPSAKVIPLFG
jgi:EAL domain-containing protein (putative c-di-GMP-specific phosphodiesterase class I)